MKKTFTILIMGAFLSTSFNLVKPQSAQAIMLVDRALGGGSGDGGGGYIPLPSFGVGDYCGLIFGILLFPVCFLDEEGADLGLIQQQMQGTLLENGYNDQEAAEIVHLRELLDEKLVGSLMFLEQNETRETFNQSLKTLFPEMTELFADFLYDYLPYSVE